MYRFPCYNLFLTAFCCGVIGCSFVGTSPDVPNDDPLLYVHDFGVVRPQSEQKHIFSIKNPTATDWTICKVVQNCSCTIVTLPSNLIPAGDSLDIEMSYQAGKELTDDHRDSVVQFEQEDVSPITLRVEAQIRPQIIFQPKHVTLSAYIPNEKYHETVTIHDWSDNGLKTVEFYSDEPWIGFSPPKKNRSKNKSTEPNAPFGVWTSSLTVDSANLSLGKHQGRITVLAKDKKSEYTAYIDVTLDIVSVVRAIPSNLFFGEIPLDEETTVTSTLLVVPAEKIGIQTGLWNLMTIESDIPENILRTEISKVTESKGILTVFLTPKTFGCLQGSISLKFGNGQFHKLSLPVIAYVKGEPITPSFKEMSNAKTE